jgi:hypothetical protein
MSASPPKDDVEQAAQSPDDPDAQMNQDPHNQGLAYEFEVKGTCSSFKHSLYDADLVQSRTDGFQ